jgi:hypothetical protein
VTAIPRTESNSGITGRISGSDFAGKDSMGLKLFGAARTVLSRERCSLTFPLLNPKTESSIHRPHLGRVA